jgi:hypothetical protein
MDYKRTAKAFATLVILGFLAAYGSCAAYYLPSTEKVTLTGTEIKRLDSKDGSILHDVRYLQGRTLNGESIVFRNEDTRWGFPFYFKFNAADLSSEVANIVRNEPEAVVLVSYYGGRSQMLDLYPNTISFKKVPKDYTHVPIFNIVFVVLSLAVVIGVVVFSRRKLVQLGEWWAKKRAPAATAAK